MSTYTFSAHSTTIHNYILTGTNGPEVRWLTQLGVSKDNITPSKTGFGLAKAD